MLKEAELRCCGYSVGMLKGHGLRKFALLSAHLGLDTRETTGNENLDHDPEAAGTLGACLVRFHGSKPP